MREALRQQEINLVHLPVHHARKSQEFYGTLSKLRGPHVLLLNYDIPNGVNKRGQDEMLDVAHVVALRDGVILDAEIEPLWYSPQDYPLRIEITTVYQLRTLTETK